MGLVSWFKDQVKRCHLCSTNRPPIASRVRNGCTALLWSCDHCPNIWVEEIKGEWTAEQIKEATRFESEPEKS